MDAITAVLEIMLRAVSSSFMRNLSDKLNVMKSIGGSSVFAIFYLV